MDWTQKQRLVEIATPLGKEVLVINRMTATETLGRIYQFDIELLAQNQNIQFDDILGQRVTVRLTLPSGKPRYFSGHVSGFSQVENYDRFFAYHAVVHPWLWFLTRTTNCRIFQNQGVPDIVSEIFRTNGFSDFELLLSGQYKPSEFTVQYRESDFDFVSRLMEREGIYYYFKHDNDKHTMVLADSVSSHQPLPGYEKVPYYPRQANLRRERDFIDTWNISQQVSSGACALNDFDFKRPKANLQVKSAHAGNYVMSGMEVYDYPGKYVETDEGEHYARARIEELQADHEIVHAAGDARGLGAGCLFQLTGQPRMDQNQEYLVVSSSCEIVSDQYVSGTAAGEGKFFSCSLSLIPSKQPFRAPRLTPKPVVQGPQTAIVVGPQGEEIYTDKFGRVKVRFHWDRYTKGDATSSCWVRVAQVWAGSKWGAIHIPRIGQEVIVDFLEGDPDRPIITGRVYNNDNMPPYDLPANMTQSGIKTKSSKGGGAENVNELRFEDLKGSEMIFIQAEKDKEIRTKNIMRELVGKDSHLTVTNELRESIGSDKHVKVKGNHNEDVVGTISIHAGGDIQEKLDGKYGLDAGGEIHLKAGMNVVIDAGVQITLNASGSFITIGPSGVVISGTTVMINSGGSPGSGASCSPESPKAPEEPGKSAAVDEESLPPLPTAPSPQAAVFKAAAVTGAPFCAT